MIESRPCLNNWGLYVCGQLLRGHRCPLLFFICIKKKYTYFHLIRRDGEEQSKEGKKAVSAAAIVDHYKKKRKEQSHNRRKEKIFNSLQVHSYEQEFEEGLFFFSPSVLLLFFSIGTMAVVHGQSCGTRDDDDGPCAPFTFGWLRWRQATSLLLSSFLLKKKVECKRDSRRGCCCSAIQLEARHLPI